MNIYIYIFLITWSYFTVYECLYYSKRKFKNNRYILYHQNPENVFHPLYLILDFSQLFIADAPMKKKSKNIVLPPRRALFKNPGTPLQTKWKIKISHMESKNRIKRMCGVHFRRNFWKIFKNKDFVFKFFEKGQILMSFSCLALCVYRGIVWYHFQYGLYASAPHGWWVGKIANGRKG